MNDNRPPGPSPGMKLGTFLAVVMLGFGMIAVVVNAASDNSSSPTTTAAAQTPPVRALPRSIAAPATDDQAAIAGGIAYVTAYAAFCGDGQELLTPKAWKYTRLMHDGMPKQVENVTKTIVDDLRKFGEPAWCAVMGAALKPEIAALNQSAERMP